MAPEFCGFFFVWVVGADIKVVAVCYVFALGSDESFFVNKSERKSQKSYSIETTGP